MVSFLLYLLYLLSSTCVQGTMNLNNYKLTWDQDFTSMSTLSVSPWGPSGPGNFIISF